MENNLILNEPAFIDYKFIPMDYMLTHERRTIEKKNNTIIINYSFIEYREHDSLRIKLNIVLIRDSFSPCYSYDVWHAVSIYYEYDCFTVSCMKYTEIVCEDHYTDAHKEEIDKTRIKFNRYLTEDSMNFTLNSLGNNQDKSKKIDDIMSYIRCNKFDKEWKEKNIQKE